MAPDKAMGGRSELQLLVIGGEDLRLALLAGSPGTTAPGGGLAEALLSRDSSVRVEVHHVDVPPLIELVALLREGGSGLAKTILADRLDVVVLSLMPHIDCSPQELTTGITELVGRVRAASGAHVLVANGCTFGATDEFGPDGAAPLRQRLRRLNLALMRLSSDLAISIVDADRLMTELGARRVSPHPFRLTAEGHAALCGEVERILDDYGFFEDRPLVAQVAREAG